MLGGRNPDTRVAYRKLKCFTFRPTLRHSSAVCGKTDIQHDLTFGRKLYGIPNQVDQYLPQSACIPCENVRRHGRHTTDQLDLLLMGAYGQGFERFIKALPE